MNHDMPSRSIDWAKINQRLAKAEEAIMRGQSQAPEARRAALEARARALAAEPANANRGPGMEVIEFLLGSNRYAVPASNVCEVRPLQELTPLPCTPAFVSGIMSAHGRIIAVVDLKKFLDLPESGLTDLNKVIILQHAAMEFGVLADSIVGGHRLLLADLQASFSSSMQHRANCIRGITPQQLTVLDVQGIASDPAFVVDEEVSG
ncbi:MAG: purine-binding chemotaxis protein CheW [Burkholderiales bacterium]|jgi:purine-binding chemotaxis protein CheW|nr:purine-binding chemotaxis protein CheW [Burkholderiales bacterium]